MRNIRMKILNLYAGIGGNRKLWEGHEVTSVEFDPAIAKAYKARFPSDKLIIGCAKEYLLNHYKEFDFIWASPPCQTHSAIRQCKVDCRDNIRGSVKAVYPDMSLYEIILFLDNNNPNNFKWVVENVRPYYKPLIKPDAEIDRHLYWSNFKISKIDVKKNTIIEKTVVADCDFDLKGYGIKRVQQVIRNQVNYEIGKHILDCAMDKIEIKQGGLF
jgi:DNA (cytosine-5)-methyltransferase 1